MAWQVRDFIWKSNRQTGARRLMLLAIADCAYAEDGKCYQSVAGLAKKCNVSDRQATYLLSALEKEGDITRQKRHKQTWIIRVAGYSPEDSSGEEPCAEEVSNVEPQSLAPPNGNLPRKTPQVYPAKSCAQTLREPLREEEKPEKKPKGPSARKRTDAPLPDNTAGLLQEWWKCTPDTHRPAKCRDNERIIYAVKGWRTQAQSLAEHGVTRRDVAAFVPHWLDKRPDETLNFGNLANDIIAWKQKHGPPDTDGKRFVNGKYAEFIDS